MSDPRRSASRSASERSQVTPLVRPDEIEGRNLAVGHIGPVKGFDDSLKRDLFFSRAEKQFAAASQQRNQFSGLNSLAVNGFVLVEAQLNGNQSRRDCIVRICLKNSGAEMPLFAKGSTHDLEKRPGIVLQVLQRCWLPARAISFYFLGIGKDDLVQVF
jgi:hypothetical protein